MVYNEMGETLPDGVSDDGSMGFAIYYNKMHLKSKKGVPDKQTLFYQIEGIRAFLSKRAVTSKLHGTVKKPLTISEALKIANSLPKDTIFLVLAGEEDFPGQGISSMAHWTLGQVQGGKAVFYDHQTKVKNQTVREFLAKKGQSHGVNLDFQDTTSSETIIGPLGQKLDEDDGRVILMEVKQ